MRTFILLFTVASLPFAVFSQYNFRPGAYHQDLSFYNPAALPETGGNTHRALLYTRMKRIENDPGIWNKSPTVFADYLNYNDTRKHGFSISFINDTYSFFSRNTLYGGFTKLMQLGENTSLSLGGKLVLHTDIISWKRYQLPHNESGTSTRFSPDVDLGVQFRWKGFKLGASAKNIVGMNQKLEGLSIIRTKRAFVLHTSYDFNIKDKVILSPYLMVYHEMKAEFDAGLYLNVLKRVSASYFFRINELRSNFMLELRLFRGLSVGACYDMSPLKPDNNLDVFVRYFF